MKKLEKGSVLSETSFYVVDSVAKDHVVVIDEGGNSLKIGNKYVENVLNSADNFEEEQKKTMTELADIFVNSKGIAMTVAFYKKDTNKTAKAYKAEKEAAIEKITNAKVAEVPALLNELIENPISKVIAGELRVMKGRHYGGMDDLGRIHFVDMELPKGTDAKGGDTRMRQVDPRTIQYVIVDNVKYTLK